jgi:hypothetical protein
VSVQLPRMQETMDHVEITKQLSESKCFFSHVRSERVTQGL